MGKKLISIVTACYNEEENVDEIHHQIKKAMEYYTDRYDYEHLYIDNASEDRTVEKIKNIIETDKHVRLIVNMRNFGQVRSPYYGLLQANGDAVISMACDMQDPPDMIRSFIDKWAEEPVNVVGIKIKSQENLSVFMVRKIFYALMARISETTQIKNYTGFGLYDRRFLEILRGIHDPYPYLRGLITDIGFERIEIAYEQPARKKGVTKNNFFSLYEIAMLGFVNHSKLPLRISSFLGFVTSFLSFLVALVYFFYKLLYWNTFDIGIAPMIMGIFFIGGVQLFFLGIIGEYIHAIFTQVKNRPLVIEKERVNFGEPTPMNANGAPVKL